MVIDFIRGMLGGLAIGLVVYALFCVDRSARVDFPKVD